MKTLNFNHMTTSQLIAFIYMHTNPEKFADQLLGTMIATKQEIKKASDLVKARNRAAFQRDLENRKENNQC